MKYAPGVRPPHRKPDKLLHELPSKKEDSQVTRFQPCVLPGRDSAKARSGLQAPLPGARKRPQPARASVPASPSPPTLFRDEGQAEPGRSVVPTPKGQHVSHHAQVAAHAVSSCSSEGQVHPKSAPPQPDERLRPVSCHLTREEV